MRFLDKPVSDKSDVTVYIYTRMKLGGSGGMPPQGKFEFLGKITLHLRPF